jgi:hypothetical protein
VATHTVNLSWTASTDSTEAGFSGYNVLRGTVSGGPYTKVNSAVVTGTSFSDIGPFSSLGPFFYVAESVAGSTVSVFSNEISVFLPPAAPTALTLVSVT